MFCSIRVFFFFLQGLSVYICAISFVFSIMPSLMILFISILSSSLFLFSTVSFSVMPLLSCVSCNVVSETLCFSYFLNLPVPVSSLPVVCGPLLPDHPFLELFLPLSFLHGHSLVTCFKCYNRILVKFFFCFLATFF